MKLNVKHFIEKKKTTVDDIDLEFLQRPMKCSTPTPSVDNSTILAGHLDISITDIASTMDDKEEIGLADMPDLDNDDDIFTPYISAIKRKSSTTKPVPKLSEVETSSDKNTYCSDWIVKNDGVSTNNADAPPSLYDPSVALSDSLMNITSVSRNIPKSPQKGKKNTLATTSLKKYANTVFM